MTTRTSVCALDCPDCCGLLVNIDNGRATRLRGNPDHPVTQGFLCAKVTRYLDRQYSPDRLLFPQRRIGPKGPGARFERISWQEAVDTITARLTAITAQHGITRIYALHKRAHQTARRVTKSRARAPSRRVMISPVCRSY